MDNSETNFLLSGERSASKLAEEGILEGDLVPLYTEPDDSGIESVDSDDPSASARRAALMGEASSSEEDLADKRNSIDKTTDAEKETLEWLYPSSDLCSHRSSPPLFEVELTASDEDDDGSVLELVIPCQSSRYQRVPTSSPIKKKKEAPRSFSLFCCMRR